MIQNTPYSSHNHKEELWIRADTIRIRLQSFGNQNNVTLFQLLNVNSRHNDFRTTLDRNMMLLKDWIKIQDK